MKIRRNSLCSCGCGKKVKVCRADTLEAADKQRRQREAERLKNRTGFLRPDYRSLPSSLLVALIVGAQVETLNGQLTSDQVGE